jgi:hypothetical protein
MVLPFTIDGARVVIPGVYDVLRVQASLPAPVPAGRSLLILGESEIGVPGDLLDLRLNFFTDFQSVKDYYVSGPIVDAARMAFTTQPSPVFGGALQRLYVWKTNSTTRATKAIVSPAGYGSIAAAVYGESGNFIKSQIKAFAEVKPSKVLSFLPSPAAKTFKIGVDGVVSSVALPGYDNTVPEGRPTDFATALGAISGLSASATTPRVAPVGTISVSAITATGDDLTLTTGGSFGTAVVPGDIMVIPVGSLIAGGADENAGVFEVMAWSATSITIRQRIHWLGTAEAAMVAPFVTAVAIPGVDNGAFQVYPKTTVTVTGATPTGAGADLELAGASGAITAEAEMVDLTAFAPIISVASAGVGSIAAVSAPAGALTLSLANASWSTIPQPGDLIRINRTSALAGAGLANVGMFIVASATSTTVNMINVFGLASASVSSVLINGNASIVEWAPGFVSSQAMADKIDSSAEAQVWIDATQVQTGVSFPTTAIGGQVFLEVGFVGAGATAASVSIDPLRTMTITPVGGSISPLVIRLNKYKTLQNLADFINTQTGFAASVPVTRNKTLPTSVLDMVQSVGALGAWSAGSTPARLKGDYYSFKTFLDNNFGLIAFAPGTLILKAGLPAAEATAAFLQGAVIGGTLDSDVQAGLDAALKIDVRNVVPLISRDAVQDVSDSLTDPASSYTIDSTNAAVKAHVATASSIKVKRERFGVLSVHDSFANAKQKCANMGYERLQMTFQLFNALDGSGAIQWFLPWMGAVAVATGRSQAALGTSMLRKPIAVTAVKHIGAKSVFDDTLVPDFDPEDVGMLEDAITAGLLTFRAVQGFGVRMESPDLTTRSRENDPEGWVWERANVLFTLDEVRQTVRSVLENFIGNRQADTSTAVIKDAILKTLGVFVASGALLNAVVDKVVREGTGYHAFVRVIPGEALEFISLDVLAERAPQG